jgi:hypothetical protein
MIQGIHCDFRVVATNLALVSSRSISSSVFTLTISDGIPGVAVVTVAVNARSILVKGMLHRLE